MDDAAAAVRSALRSISPAYRSLDRDLLHAADLVVDERSALVAHRGRVLPLTRTEYGILRHLARHLDRAASRARIVERVRPLRFAGRRPWSTTTCAACGRGRGAGPRRSGRSAMRGTC